jgi:hypothetical protein
VTGAVGYLFTFTREPPVCPVRVPGWRLFILNRSGIAALHFNRNAVAERHYLLAMISPKEIAGIPSGDEVSWVGASWNDRRWY